jgi:hypothetical protein
MDCTADENGMSEDAVIEEAILALCRKRGPEKTICPSEAARMLDADEAAWRLLMPAVRNAAERLAKRGLIEVCQRGQAIDIADAKGPIRLRLRWSSGTQRM